MPGEQLNLNLIRTAITQYTRGTEIGIATTNWAEPGGFADYAEEPEETRAPNGTVTGRYYANTPTRMAGMMRDYAEYMAEPMPNDRLALEDDTPIGDWRPKELNNEKKKQTIVKLDKETAEVIEVITKEIIDETLETLKRMYKLRVDSIDNFDYNNLIESFNADVADNTHYQHFQLAAIGHDDIVQGRNINRNGAHSWYLERLEHIALRRYHVDYSKYRFYPRSKDKVKYGNPELLAKILSVTQISKGKVICPSLT